MKGGSMKRFLVLFAVLLLALPAVSFAGSATSRWDVTIGGFVKADFGYTDQGVSGDAYIANRKSGSSDNAYDKYGNYFNSSGQTTLNFLIKGPDTWGAKSSAFIEADFRGGYGTPSSYGLFDLRHAFIKFDWPTASLLIGKYWQPWGLLPCFCLLNYNELGPFNKGQRNPQITFTQYFTKEISLALALMSPVNELGTTQGENVVNQYSRYPQLGGELLYKTDMLGKIGPWMLQFGLGGFVGRQKAVFDRTTGALIPDIGSGGQTAGGNAAAGSFSDQELNIWGLSFKSFIPIIPEKKPGAPAGSLGMAWTAFAGQGWNGVYQSPLTALPTSVRGPVGDREYANPNFWGGWGQIMYYLTDKVSINGQYGMVMNNVSSGMRAANPNTLIDLRHYIFNVIYDPTPALRVGIEYTHVYTKYGAPVSGLADYGKYNQVRMAAYYFF
jgi:hypothetical protein